MRIAVAGGTGTVGRYVVQAAEQSGHHVVVLSRRAGIDLQNGEGLAAALEGIEVVVDATNAGTTNQAKATAFFCEVSRRLQTVATAQGVTRLVTLSIVGADRVPGFGYYQAKLAHEAAALEGPLPATIVRATQFHEFPAQIFGRTRMGPVAMVPRMRVQPIAARTVGEWRQTYSPMTVTVISRSRGRSSKSHRTICCHLPKLRRPSTTGKFLAVPMMALRRCA